MNEMASQSVPIKIASLQWPLSLSWEKAGLASLIENDLGRFVCIGIRGLELLQRFTVVHLFNNLCLLI